MAEQSLGLESVPFFKKPLDASESDRIVGQDDTGNFVYQTFLGNKYTVARDPDQRTTRTKIEEDVIPAVKAYAENPRLPTGEEVVGAGKAIVEGAVETASIPGDLLTGKRSPTSVQMGDAFDIAGGAAVGAGLQTLPDNAVGSMVGAFRRKDKPYLKKSIGVNPDLDKTLSIKDTFSEEGIKELYSIKNPSRSGYFYIANQIFDTVNIKDFMENVYSKLDTKSLTEPRFVQYFDAPSGEDIVKQYSDKLVLNVPKDIQDKTSNILSRNFTKLIDNLRYQQFAIDEDSKFRRTRAYDVYPVKDDIFVPTETELAFPSPRFEQEKNRRYSTPVQTITLGSPITPYVETMDIPKKGITGKNFLADIRKNLKVPVRVFQDDFIEGNKRYTREELLKLVEEKEFKVKAQEQGQYSGMQRQNEAGFTYGDEQEYFFMNIAATTGAGKITPRRQHASSDDIGHVRGSIITPSISSNFDANTETIFDVVTESKPILLAEEFQSDLYQKGYKTTNPKFMQQEIETSQYGRFSKEVQKIIADSSTAANKANIPAVNDYGYIKNNTLLLTNESIERTMKDATDRGYIGGDTFDSVSFSVDRLKDIETDAVFKGAYLDPERIEKTVRRFAEEGVSINLPETETFRAEMFVPPSVDVETVFKVDPLSLSNSSFIVDQSTFLDSNPQVLFRVQSMDPNTAEIFNTTTIGELNAATKEWLESLSMSAQSQGFVPSLIEDAVRNETNAERMGRGDRITADDIGGRSSGTIGDLGTISEVAENLVRKKLGLDFTEATVENPFSLRYVNYPDNTEGYFRLINAYSDLIYQQVSFPEDTVNVLGKLSATKKTNDEQNKKLEDYIAKTARSILKYREKITDEEDMIAFHFEKFVSKLDGTEIIPKQAKGLLRDAYKDLKRNTNDFQGLDAVTPPINKVKSVTDEMLKTLIVKAATSGVDKIVIPPTDRLAAVRFADYKEYPPKFLAIMDKGLPASIQEFKKSYPEVNVSYNVEMPYDNSMYPPGSNNIPSNEGTVIDLKEFLKKYNVSPEGEVRQFAQGGVAMKDQMEMSFALGGVAETVDPVSGNDVPPGSLPEEVRDDIPARLSEGEYVVPADVVRYYGVKFFEDLRTQAKMGLTQMDADGRIGGEPMEPQQAELSDDDLNSIIEQAMQQEQPMMANEGGVVGYKHGGYHPPDFLGMSVFGDTTKTDDTSANQFYDVSDYKPTAGDYGTPEAAAPTVTANVPDPVCPIGQVYSKDKQMCVPKEEGTPNPDPTTTTSSSKFFEDKNFFTSPTDYINSLINPDSATGKAGELLDNKLVQTGLALAGPAGLAIGAGVQGLSSNAKLQNLASMRAAIEIQKALGKPVSDKITASVKAYEDSLGAFAGLLENVGVASGKGRLDEFAREVLGKEDWKSASALGEKELKTLIETSSGKELERQKESRRQERIRAEQEAAAVAAREAARRATLTQSQKTQSQKDSDRDDSYQTRTERGYGTSYTGAKTGTLDTKTGKTNRAYGGRATGGLVQKRKKK